MNILFIFHERNLGGGTKSAITLVEELKERGHHVIAIVPFRFGQAYKELKKKKIEVKVVFFGWWMMPNYWGKCAKFAFRIMYKMENLAVLQIASIAKKENIQVLHSNSSVIDVGARAAVKTGIPHVWHIREYGDKDYRLEFLKGRKKSCDFMKGVPGKILFISQDLRKYYKNDICGDICKVIYNGLPKQYLCHKEQICEMKEKVIFLTAGNLQRNKRQDLAISACEILESRGYNNYQLVIAGTQAALRDSRRFEKELREQAKKLKKEKIVFTGFVSDMAELRQRTDVELVCSAREAFGRVTIEAMMASNPVIASNSGASPELIKEEKNGWLFEEGSAVSLADCMEKVLKKPSMIREMGGFAFNYAQNLFSSCRNTEQIETVYKTLIGDKS